MKKKPRRGKQRARGGRTGLVRRVAERLFVTSLGVLLCIALLEGGLRLSRLEIHSVQRLQNWSAMQASDAIRVMCVGESTTAMGGKHAYPTQLEQVLLERSTDHEYRVINVGVGGADTAMLLAQLPANLETYQPHVVVAMMGGNDMIGKRAPGVPNWDLPLPATATPLEDRSGFPRTLKTYRLAELLWFYVQREGEGVDLAEAAGPELPADAAHGDEIWSRAPRPGVAHGPDNYYSESSRPPAVAEAWALVAAGDPVKAEARFRAATEAETQAATEAETRRIRARIEYGAFLERSGRVGEAEAMFEAVITAHPNTGFGYFGRGQLLAAQGDCAGAEEQFDRAGRRDVRCGHGHVTAALCYLDQGDDDRAHAALNRALKFKNAVGPVLHDENEGTAYRHFYRVEGREGEIFEQLTQPGGHNPMDPFGDIAMLDLWEELGDHQRIEALAGDMERSGAMGEVGALRLAQYYRDAGLEDRAGMYVRMVREARGTGVSPMTRESYEQLQALLDQHGIPLVAAQYANRSVAPLQELIDWNDDVVFADNEGVFREALQAHSYDDLFWDHCFGDSGHGTPLGNRILAENIATTVLSITEPGTTP